MFKSITIVLCIVSTLFFVISALASHDYNNQSKSLDIHEKILTEYKENHLDYFGGFFLDDEDVLNINLVEDNEQKAEKNNQLNVKELVKGDNVKFRHVKYSLAELHNTTNVISNEMLTLGIKAVELDEINNAVVVYLESLSKEVEVKSKLKNKLDFSPVIFKEMPYGIELQFQSDM